MIKLIARIPCALVDGRWWIRSSEQRDRDSREKDQQSKRDAEVHEPAIADPTLHRRERRNSSRARDSKWDLSGAFLFHGRGVPLTLVFLRAPDARCRDNLSKLSSA